MKSLLLTRLIIGTVKDEQKSHVHICLSDKILCSNETAVEAQCVSEEVENCFCLKQKTYMPLFGNIFSKIFDEDKGADSHLGF